MRLPRPQKTRSRNDELSWWDPHGFEIRILRMTPTAPNGILTSSDRNHLTPLRMFSLGSFIWLILLVLKELLSKFRKCIMTNILFLESRIILPLTTFCRGYKTEGENKKPGGTMTRNLWNIPGWTIYSYTDYWWSQKKSYLLPCLPLWMS